MRNNEARVCLMGILIGLSLGVAIGYLTAPKSGSETRTLIRDKMGVIKSKAQEAFSSIKQRVPGGNGE